MSNVVNEFEQDNQVAYCVYVAHCNGSYLFVQHIECDHLTDYIINARHLDAIKNISSLAALVDYAKADQVQPQAATPCPCPPETLDCAVKSDLSKVDGGIPLCPFCGSTFYRDDLGSCYDCFFPSERGE